MAKYPCINSKHEVCILHKIKTASLTYPMEDKDAVSSIFYIDESFTLAGSWR